MTKYFFYFFMCFLLPVTSFSGPSVIGTRFFLTPETKAINVKIINDDESDYLIKTDINNSEFIITPPLFILLKDSSNIITIIPSEVIKANIDKIYQLTITAIPKSQKNSNSIVSIATRSHFNIIYQNKKYDNDDFSKVKLNKDNQGEYWLENQSNNIFYIEWYTDEKFKYKNTSILPANKNLHIKACSYHNTCQVWIDFLSSNNLIIKSINLFHNK